MITSENPKNSPCSTQQKESTTQNSHQERTNGLYHCLSKTSALMRVISKTHPYWNTDGLFLSSIHREDLRQHKSSISTWVIDSCFFKSFPFVVLHADDLARSFVLFFRKSSMMVFCVVGFGHQRFLRKKCKSWKRRMVDIRSVSMTGWQPIKYEVISLGWDKWIRGKRVRNQSHVPHRVPLQLLTTRTTRTMMPPRMKTRLPKWEPSLILGLSG